MSRPLLEAVLLALVPQVSLCRAQIDNLGTAVSVLLHLCALFTVVGIRDALIAAYDASPLEAAEVALVADCDECAGSDIGIADDALPVIFLTESADRHSWLLSAEDQVWMMFSHYENYIDL